MLIIEVILTIKAWKKGWGARALLPWGGAVLALFLVMVTINAGGGAQVDFRPLEFLLDLALIIALAMMSRRVPAPKASREAVPSTPVVGTSATALLAAGR